MLNDNVYLTGTGIAWSEAWRFDLLSGEYFRCADMITGRLRHCAAIVDAQIYVLGGWVIDSTLLSTVECYNTMTNKWSPAGHLVQAVDVGCYCRLQE